jgi:Ran GTPase-activating protein (RanGAP) involved in mRNA processing and transport
MFRNLKGLPHLKEVDVSDSPITDATLEHLSRFVTLRKLDIRRTNVTDEGVGKFKKAVPECEVLR